jgi:hypothetical protein
MGASKVKLHSSVWSLLEVEKAILKCAWMQRCWLTGWSCDCRFSSFVVCHVALMLMKRAQKWSNCRDPTDISWFLWQVLCVEEHTTPCPDLDGIFCCFTRRKNCTILAGPFSLSCKEINNFLLYFFFCTPIILQTLHSWIVKSGISVLLSRGH